MTHGYRRSSIHTAAATRWMDRSGLGPGGRTREVEGLVAEGGFEPPTKGL